MRVTPADRLGGAPPHSKPRSESRWGKPRRGLFRRLVRLVVLSALLAIVLSWLVVLPLRWIEPPTTAFMLLDESKSETLRYAWVSWSDIGSSIPIAVVAAEDQKFADHSGFDLDSIKQSVEDYAEGEALRGASTISQQVAKNLYLWPGRSFVRKGIEAYFTVLIEASLSKQRILEIYVNIAEFGPGIYGVREASKFYFEKTPAELSDAEAAMLAAILPNPKQLRVINPSPYVLNRQDWIFGQMQRLRREGWISRLNQSQTT